jgi:hypothetical protein
LERIFPVGLQPVPEVHGFADAQPLSSARGQPLQSQDIVFRIEAVMAGSAGRRRESIAPLPGSDCVRLKPGLGDDDLEIEGGDCG